MDTLIVLFFCIILNYVIITLISKNNNIISKKYAWLLYLIHNVLGVVYIIYSSLTTSDSFSYFKTSSTNEDWLGLLNTGTSFIRFLAWPLCNVLGLSYYSVMTLFSNLGFIGILLLYCCAKENIHQIESLKLLGIPELVFFLPNIHFWSTSLGKGSVMMFGIGLFFFGISRFNYRIMQIVFGGLIIYFTRPHILFCCVISISISLLLALNKLTSSYKIILLIISFLLVYIVSNKAIEFTEIESFNVFNSQIISHRAQELSKSSSGIDLSNYNLLSKMLTFWFRPLFFDANGFMGVIVSFENIVLIIMIISVLKKSTKFLTVLNGYHLSCIFSFILGSFALAQVSGNLGIALRQKAQLLPLFFIFYVKLMSIKNHKKNDA